MCINKDDVKIEESPKLPPELIEAYENNKLVVFIGAGISRLMGCMGWEDMANKLIKTVCTPIMSDQLLNRNIGSKEKITIAYRYAEKNEENKKKFWEVFSKAISAEGTEPDIYEVISRLNTIYITTNCDGLLVNHFKKSYTTTCTLEEYKKRSGEELNRNYVFCIHGNYGNGSDDDKSSLIFTVDKYLEAYQSGSDLFNFLRTVMDDNVVLFLGYGLSEFEILNACFKSVEDRKTTKHYVLEGFFTYQKELCEALTEYYSSLGIRLIPYSKDNKEYNQQRFIIENWIKELEYKTSYNSKGLQLINDSMREFNETSKEIVKNSLLRGDEVGLSYRKAIFGDLPRNKDCYCWIRFLCDELPIKSEDIPAVERTENGYRLITWDFIVCISTCIKNQEPGDKDREFITLFVKNCMACAIEKEDVLKNDYTVSILAETFFQLNCIPKEEKEWEFLKQWSEESSCAYQVIEQYIKQIEKWDTNDAGRFLNYIFAPGNELNQEHRSYWFKRLADRISKFDNEELIYKVLVGCTKHLLEIEKDSYLHRCFADHFHIRNYGYSISLVESLKIFIKSLGFDNKSKYINSLLSTANGIFDYQTAFHLGGFAEMGDPAVIKRNPLKTENVFVDFYLWVSQMICNSSFSNKRNLSLIASWVKEATFGLDLAGIEEDEIVQFYKKRINTMKYQLLDLLCIADSSYESDRDSISLDERFDSKTPEEDMEQNYTFRRVSPEKYFEDVDVEGKSGSELIEIAKAEKTKIIWGDERYQWNELIEQLSKRIDDEQLESFIEEAFNSKDIPVTCITRLITDIDIINRLNKEFVDELTEKIFNIIQRKTDDAEDRKNIIRHYIYLLQNLNRCGWTSIEVLQKVVVLDPKTLYDEDEPYNNDMDVIMNVINISESQLYVLAIDSAANCKGDEDNISAFKKWILSNVDSKISQWFIYACSYRIQNLLYIDEKLGSRILSITDSDNHYVPGEEILCMCFGSEVIIPQVVDYISKGNRIQETCRRVEENSNNKLADSFISYIAAAKFYGNLGEENYIKFISCINDDNVRKLVWSCIYKIKSEKRQEKIHFLEYTYDLYCKDKDQVAISKAVIDCISRMDVVDDDCWRLIAKVICNAIDTDRIWENVEECIGKTESKNDSIEKAIEYLQEGKCSQYDFTLKRVMHNLAKIDMLTAVQKVARFAMNHTDSPNDFIKYEDKPEDALTDFVDL